MTPDTIHHGDCIEGMRKLPGGSVDLAFADPPFNIGYEYDQYDDRKETGQYLEWCREWMTEIHRVLRPDGTFWLAIGDEYAAELKIEAQRCGFHTRNWVTWYYTFGVHCKNKFTRSHAHLLYFVKSPDRFTFNGPAVAVPSARQRIYGDKRAAAGGRIPDDTWILRPPRVRRTSPAVRPARQPRRRRPASRPSETRHGGLCPLIASASCSMPPAREIASCARDRTTRRCSSTLPWRSCRRGVISRPTRSRTALCRSAGGPDRLRLRRPAPPAAGAGPTATR